MFIAAFPPPTPMYHCFTALVVLEFSWKNKTFTSNLLVFNVQMGSI